MARAKSREEIEEVVARVAYADRKFHLLPKGDGYLLQLSYMEADVETGEPALQKSRKWYVSPYMTESEIVETAFLCAQQSAEHVLTEHFTYKGRRVYSRHFHIDQRVSMCDRQAYDGRESAARTKMMDEARMAAPPGRGT